MMQLRLLAGDFDTTVVILVGEHSARSYRIFRYAEMTLAANLLEDLEKFFLFEESDGGQFNYCIIKWNES